MKRIFAIFAVVGSLAVCSCKKAAVVEQKDDPKVSLSQDELEFEADASELFISLESNADWVGETDAEWLTVEPRSGNAGSRKIKISVSQNALSKSRAAIVSFSSSASGTLLAKLLVSQNAEVVNPTAPYLKLDRDMLEFGADASEDFVSMETNLPWKISKAVDWVTVDPSEGEAGSRKIKFSVSRNNLLVARQGILTFSDIYGKFSFDLIVNQKESEAVETEDYIDDEGENHGPGILIDGVVWAPVNCGHKKADIDLNGRLYQWGRKYGILNHLDAKYEEIEGPVSLEVGESKENENVFIKVTNQGDWLLESNNSLWRNGTPNNPIKTQYDPCPNGWRIPTKAELTSLSKNHSTGVEYDGQRGRWFSGQTEYSEEVVSIFLPAADSSFGKDFRGTAYPHYWTSDVDNSSRPWALEFDGIKGGGRCGMSWQGEKKESSLSPLCQRKVVGRR